MQRYLSTLAPRLLLCMMVATIMLSFFAVVPSADAAGEDGAFTNPLNTTNPFAIPGDPATDTKTREELVKAAVEPWGRVVKMIVNTLGVFMFLMIAYGGFQYLTAAGDAEKAEAGMKRVLWAVLGGGVILASYVLAVWLVVPLGSIFGLNQGVSQGSADGSDVSGKKGIACCKFTAPGNITYIDIDLSKESSCERRSFTVPEFREIQIRAYFSRLPVGYRIEQIDGKKCAEVRGDTTDPTGCCVADASVAAWKGLRCNFGAKSACDNEKTFHKDIPCDQVSGNPCRTWPLCCVWYKNGNSSTNNPADILGYADVQYDGTNVTANSSGQSACAAARPDLMSRDPSPQRYNEPCSNRPLLSGGPIQPPGNGGTTPPAAQQCCVPDWDSWSYSNNRGICFAPTEDVSGAFVCQGGWKRVEEACSAIPATCTKPQPNPPPEPSGCCYWKDPGQQKPMCTQWISETLCTTAKRKKDPVTGRSVGSVWFIPAGNRVENCTSEPGGVDCVYDPNAPRNRP